MPPASSADEQRLKELQQALWRFSDRAPPNAARFSHDEAADCARVTPEDICSRSKRKAPSPPSMAPAEPPGIVAGGSVASSCASQCLKPVAPVHPPPERLTRPLPPPPPGLGLPYFVISLEDSIGERRLSNMNLPALYTIVKGVRPDDVPDHITQHWNVGRMSLERNRALQGAFAAHVKAWHAVVAGGDDGAVVLEGDAIFYRQHPMSSAQYPRNAITLLGGCFRGFGRWGLCETSFISAGKFLDTISHLTTGVHELPTQVDRAGVVNEMRWAMCVAYYIPAGMGAQLLKVVQTTTKKNVFKSPDVFLQPFTKYFLWPPAFGDQGEHSCCFTHKKDLGTDLYCSAGMREVAEGLGRPLPKVGCSTITLLDWQILHSKTLLDVQAGRVVAAKGRAKPGSRPSAACSRTQKA